MIKLNLEVLFTVVVFMNLFFYILLILKVKKGIENNVKKFMERKGIANTLPGKQAYLVYAFRIKKEPNILTEDEMKEFLISWGVYKFSIIFFLVNGLLIFSYRDFL